jgi:hypothetical protein
MTTEDQITFRLRYFCRFDEEVQAHVGYIPRLQLFTQAPTEEGLKDATRATALRFLIACADRGTLGDVMRESSMRKMSDSEFERHIENPESEFVRYRYHQCESIEVTLNIDALANIGVLV